MFPIVLDTVNARKRGKRREREEEFVREAEKMMNLPIVLEFCFPETIYYFIDKWICCFKNRSPFERKTTEYWYPVAQEEKS